MKNKQLKNKIALVTGASSGIGESISLELAKEGAKVCLTGRDSRKLKTVFDKCQKYSAGGCFQAADLANDEDIDVLVKKIKKDFGSLDILVHSAGTISLGKIEEDSVDNFDKQFKVNLRAPYVLTQMLLPLLKKGEAGQIIFINSTMGTSVKASVGQYAATKHGLKALADVLRLEINEDGIRVMSIYAGTTDTPMRSRIHEILGKPYNVENFMKPEEVARIIVGNIVLSESSEATEIFIRPFKKTI